MLALLAAILLFAGWIVTHAVEHVHAVWFWLFLGLIVLCLHEAFGGEIARRRNSTW